MITSKKINGTNVICEYKSSNIKEGVYNTVDKTLRVTFNNGIVYEYTNVPHEVFAALNLADSQGSYFNKNIKTGFLYKKLS